MIFSPKRASLLNLVQVQVLKAFDELCHYKCRWRYKSDWFCLDNNILIAIQWLLLPGKNISKERIQQGFQKCRFWQFSIEIIINWQRVLPGLSHLSNDEKDILDVTVEDYLTCIYNLASQVNTDLVNSRQGRKPFMTFKVNKKFSEINSEPIKNLHWNFFAKIMNGFIRKLIS